MKKLFIIIAVSVLAFLLIFLLIFLFPLSPIACSKYYKWKLVKEIKLGNQGIEKKDKRILEEASNRILEIANTIPKIPPPENCDGYGDNGMCSQKILREMLTLLNFTRDSYRV